MSGCAEPPDREVAEFVTKRRSSRADPRLALACVLGVIYLAEALQRASEKETLLDEIAPSAIVGSNSHGVDKRRSRREFEQHIERELNAVPANDVGELVVARKRLKRQGARRPAGF
jgi:hypothetical protein